MTKKVVKKKYKKRADGKNDTGRPPKYATAEALQAKIDEYFKNPPRKRKVFTKDGEVIEVSIVTITGLVLYLGFCDRASFYKLEEDPKFLHTIKRARSFIEQEYEEMLHAGNCTGAIFALKNFGWKDKTDIEHSGHIKTATIDSTNLTDEELIAKLNAHLSA